MADARVRESRGAATNLAGTRDFINILAKPSSYDTVNCERANVNLTPCCVKSWPDFWDFGFYRKIIYFRIVSGTQDNCQDW